MYEGTPRSRAEIEYRRRRAASPLMRRPDRIAAWAVVLAIVGMIAAAASAHAGGGGISTRGGGTGTSGSCPNKARFGARPLSVGDCGGDVKTLHWLLKASSYRVPLDKTFDHPTDNSVRAFQRHHHLNANGVVGERTRKQIVRTMTRSRATWYDLHGRRTACGQRLRRSTIG